MILDVTTLHEIVIKCLQLGNSLDLTPSQRKVFDTIGNHLADQLIKRLARDFNAALDPDVQAAANSLNQVNTQLQGAIDGLNDINNTIQQVTALASTLDSLVATAMKFA